MNILFIVLFIILILIVIALVINLSIEVIINPFKLSIKLFNIEIYKKRFTCGAYSYSEYSTPSSDRIQYPSIGHHI